MRQGEGGGMGLVLACLTPRVGRGPECVSKEDATVSALLKGLYQMQIWGILSHGRRDDTQYMLLHTRFT